MRKFLLALSLFVLIGFSLCAEDRNLGDGWTITTYSQGSYRLDDNNRGICYYIYISGLPDRWEVKVENWVEKNVTKAGIKYAVSKGLQSLGVILRVANIAGTVVFEIFNPSPAH
jgi:hypothetical protein